MADVALAADPWAARATAVLVPTRAAAVQLRRTLEDLAFATTPGPAAEHSVLVLPEICTRDEWYRQLHARLTQPPPLVSRLEAEVLLRAAAREAEAAGTLPPFQIRPRLIAELLDFRDALERQGRTLEQFERLLAGELEPMAGHDRGAERLLVLTRFLAATFRRYEAALDRTDAIDEHRLRRRLLAETPRDPFRRIVVTLADQAAEPEGLWPSDFDLLTRLPELDAVDVVATEEILDAGFQQRLHDWLPEFEEVRYADASRPLLESATDARVWLEHRDREDELIGAVRDLKAEARATAGRAGAAAAEGTLDRSALVFQRPLPYLYLARQVFESAGVAYDALDALPLASEPFAAALDLVFACVDAGFGRQVLTALLRSPHFEFGSDAGALEKRDVMVLDRCLAESRYGTGGGGLSETEALVRAGAIRVSAEERARLDRALEIARRVIASLEPLVAEAPASLHLRRVREWLQAHERLPLGDDPIAGRHLRARSAILSALEHLEHAYGRHDDTDGPFGELVLTIRRWLEGQTFRPRQGSGGVQLLDAQAARYGTFDRVRIVGLVEGEWPAASRPGILYPGSLLAQLGWPTERDRLAAARARFRELLDLPARRVSLSTFVLEDEAIVGPSILLEELDECGLERTPLVTSATPVTNEESLTRDPPLAAAGFADQAAWLALRRQRPAGTSAAYHGEVGAVPAATYPVTAVERYLDCPFKYFASRVVRLREEPVDRHAADPRDRGRLIHELLHEFFARWSETHAGSVAASELDEARALFGAIAERLLARLPPAERGVERRRLLGSAARSGLIERVLGCEVERPGLLRERLLEARLDGSTTLAGSDTPVALSIRGIADRIDLFEDGTIRIVDYKSGQAPPRARAVQLAVYAAAAVQRLAERDGRDWQVAEAGYIALGELRPFVPLTPRGSDLPTALAGGQARFVEAVRQIEAGRFPPRPADPALCEWCEFDGVCRKDYVAEP